MMRLRGSVFLMVAIVPIAACSSKDSSSSGTPSNGTANDGGVLADGGALADGATGAVTPAACEASIRYRQRCAETTEAKSEACAEGRRQNCSKTLPTMSPTYASAYAACTTDQVSCEDGPDACIQPKMKELAAHPSAAQAKVRDDFCATCASASCKDDFFAITEDGTGPGYQILQISDTVAAAVDAKCTGAALDVDAGGGDCVGAFRECTGEQASSALPDDPESCAPPPPPEPPEDAATQ